MDKSFSTVDTVPTPAPEPCTTSTDATSNKELLRVLLVSTQDGVISTIQNLYTLGFAEIGEWSNLLPAPNPGEVMSILTRYISTNEL